jgi:uncharacterized membrane protein
MGMNLSFIIDNSHLWLSSIMAPMTDKMFPMGVGIVGIVTGGIIHVTSPLIFDALEVTTAAICMFWYYRNCKRYPLTGVILSVVPLFFAWRSLPNYFNYVDMILLAMLLNKELLFATPGLRTVEIPL